MSSQFILSTAFCLTVGTERAAPDERVRRGTSRAARFPFESFEIPGRE
jgi:hypothetical protein